MKRTNSISNDFIEWQRAEAVAEYIVQAAVEELEWFNVCDIKYDLERTLYYGSGGLKDYEYEILCAAYLIAGCP